jgi:hypothetical protein
MKKEFQNDECPVSISRVVKALAQKLDALSDVANNDRSKFLDSTIQSQVDEFFISPFPSPGVHLIVEVVLEE